MTWIQCDIFHYEQVVAAMNQIDIAVFLSTQQRILPK